MKWLRPIFIINLVLTVLWLPIMPMFLLIVGDGLPMITVLVSFLGYGLASLWLVIRGKKNRTTTLVASFMAVLLLAIVIIVTISSKNRATAKCAHFQTQCAKLDGQAGLFHCGATASQKGFITVAHVEEKCMPTKEQSCAYAKQFCRLISPADSALTHYACSDRDTIACP